MKDSAKKMILVNYNDYQNLISKSSGTEINRYDRERDKLFASKKLSTRDKLNIDSNILRNKRRLQEDENRTFSDLVEKLRKLTTNENEPTPKDRENTTPVYDIEDHFNLTNGDDTILHNGDNILDLTNGGDESNVEMTPPAREGARRKSTPRTVIYRASALRANRKSPIKLRRITIDDDERERRAVEINKLRKSKKKNLEGPQQQGEGSGKWLQMNFM